MQAIIDNFLGCHHAEVDLDGLTLVCGPNGQGKSSLATGVGLALMGLPLPPGVKKADAGGLITTGRTSAAVAITANGTSMAVSWPACDVVGKGRPPQASAHAVGFVHALKMDAKARGKFLSEALDAMPTEAEVTKALTDAGLSEELAKRSCAHIAENGWDASLKVAADHGARLKGRWEETTEDRYGSAKATTWLPAEWEPDLEALTLEALDEIVATAKTKLEGHIRGEAVDLAELEQAREIAETESARQTVVDELKAKRPPLETALTTALAASGAVAAPEDQPQNVYQCPECGVQLIAKRGDAGEVAVLVKYEPPTPEQIAALEGQRAELEGATTTARRLLGVLDGEIAEANSQVVVAQIAAVKVRELQGKPTEGEDEDAVNEARTAVRIAERRRGAFATWERALAHHKAIGDNQKLIDVLKPTGVRHTKLQGAVADFNGALTPLGDAIGLTDVRMNDGLEISIGGRAAHLSKSERWRLRAVVQLALAKRTGEPLVVLDGAEVVVGEARPKLLAMLAQSGIPALVCMSVGKPSGIPDLASSGHGVTYWMNDGKIQPLTKSQD